MLEIEGGSIRVAASRTASAEARANAIPYSQLGPPLSAPGAVLTLTRRSAPMTRTGVGRLFAIVVAGSPPATSASRNDPSTGCSATWISSCANSDVP